MPDIPVGLIAIAIVVLLAALGGALAVVIRHRRLQSAAADLPRSVTELLRQKPAPMLELQKYGIILEFTYTDIGRPSVRQRATAVRLVAEHYVSPLRYALLHAIPDGQRVVDSFFFLYMTKACDPATGEPIANPERWLVARAEEAARAERDPAADGS